MDEWIDDRREHLLRSGVPGAAGEAARGLNHPTTEETLWVIQSYLI